MFSILSIGKVSAFLVSKWRYCLITVLVVGAFLGGRYLTPTKVITRTETVTIKDTSVANVESSSKETVKTVYVDRPVDHVVTKTVIKYPDGKVEETTKDQTHLGNTQVAITDAKTQDTKIQIKTETVYKEKVVEKIVDNTRPSPKFDVGVSVGYNMIGKGDTNLIPNLPKGMVAGAHVNYRVGEILTLPVKVGVEATSRGDVSIGLRVEF